MREFVKAVEDIYAKDSRYKPDGYEFVIQALHFAHKKLKKQGHLNGRELAQGIRDFAIEQYGPMAKTVLYHWGVRKTIDIGNIVYNMIDARLLSKTEEDSLSDFHDVYSFEDAFKGILSVFPEIKKSGKKDDKKTLQNSN